jgi:hypothetical protein
MPLCLADEMIWIAYVVRVQHRVLLLAVLGHWKPSVENVQVISSTLWWLTWTATTRRWSHVWISALSEPSLTLLVIVSDATLHALPVLDPVLMRYEMSL